MAKGFIIDGKFRPTGNNSTRSSREKSIDVIEGMTLAEQREAEIEMSDRLRAEILSATPKEILLNNQRNMKIDAVDNAKEELLKFGQHSPIFEQEMNKLGFANSFDITGLIGSKSDEEVIQNLDNFREKELEKIKESTDQNG